MPSSRAVCSVLDAPSGNVCTMSISPASSESPGYYRVVERARPPPPEHPIRNPHPTAGEGRTDVDGRGQRPVEHTGSAVTSAPAAATPLTCCQAA